MSYAYRNRKKEIKRLKKKHASELKHDQLPPKLMPKKETT